MKKKRTAAAVIAVILSAGILSACGDSGNTAPAQTDAPAGNTAAETEAAEEEVTEAEISVKDTHTNDTMRDITAAEVVAEMRIGWNLGNTLDATGGAGSDDPAKSETSWGNPVTTENMIKVLKDSGFNVIRVPVTWMGHLGDAPDYTIDEKWIDRVQEVVNYGIDNDMYVILNAHHEDWYNAPKYENVEAQKEELAALWSQIADRFGGYDEHLIFEGLNEPRLKDTPLEWNGGNEEGRDCINQFAQTFVDTVRASGKNNGKRCLMVTPYAASTDDKVLKDFIVPEGENIIVSVHAYTPYNFALADNGTAEWSADNTADTNDIDWVFAKLDDKFLKNGIPVIMGEFGSRNRFNTDARAAHAEYYVKKAKEYGVPCVWWDNGAFVGGGENFGLLVRNELRWHDQAIVDALMRGTE